MPMPVAEPSPHTASGKATKLHWPAARPAMGAPSVGGARLRSLEAVEPQPARAAASRARSVFFTISPFAGGQEQQGPRGAARLQVPVGARRIGERVGSARLGPDRARGERREQVLRRLF